MVKIEDILNQLNSEISEADRELIRRAYDFANTAHTGQTRLSGEPYIVHPLETARLLAVMNLDASTVAAALLHDVVDDTPVTSKEIEREFGPEITFMVEGVTKLGKFKYRGVERQVENLRKMFLAMAKDIRVVLIKLADRLHNLRTLGSVPERKQKRIALESMEIYAPLADRLGIFKLRGDLEDLSFPYIYPKEYQWLMKNVKERYKEREAYLKKIQPRVEEILKEEGIEPIEINSRAKHYYSLWKKLLKYDMDLEKIYDLVALRIIVPTIDKCYGALGAIHKHWKPLPGKIKDYIALPKPNGYQSLHTTVFCLDGRLTEIQIRTPEIHERAEYGIAAHWVYADTKRTGHSQGASWSALTRELGWVRQLQEWQRKTPGTQEFLDSLKIDFFKNRIFVFTPQGDVINLPEGATPVDFAYQIHSDIGGQCAGARANGKIISLDQSLSNGDMVEILVQKNKKPSESWLSFVKTSYAYDRIRSVLKKKRSAEAGPKIAKIGEVEFEFSVKDRVGLIKDISSIFSQARFNIVRLNTDVHNKNSPHIVAICETKNKHSIEKIIPKLKKVKGVDELTYRIHSV